MAALAERATGLYVERVPTSAPTPFVRHFTVSWLIPPIRGSLRKMHEKARARLPGGP